MYDYQLYDAGITLPACEDDEEEEALKANVVSLLTCLPSFCIDTHSFIHCCVHCCRLQMSHVSLSFPLLSLSGCIVSSQSSLLDR